MADAPTPGNAPSHPAMQTNRPCSLISVDVDHRKVPYLSRRTTATRAVTLLVQAQPPYAGSQEVKQ